MFTVNNKDTRRTSLVFLFSIRVFFTDTDFSQDSRGRERTIFYSTLPLPPAHEHRDIYLQLCMWDDYHVFLIATLVFTRLLLDEIYCTLSNYHLIDWWCNVCLFTWWIDSRFFVTAIWHGKPVDWTRIDYHPWHWLSPLMTIFIINFEHI